MNNKICIFGASGTSGLAITEQASSRGLEVTAFVRSEAAKEKLSQATTIVERNLLTLSDVEGTVNNCVAIVWAFGPRPSSP
jgi:putative NADH-flavin reductase